MKTKDAKDFKKSLKELPDSIYLEVELLLANHGVTNVKVDRIQVIPLDEYDTKEKCEAAGKIWKCDLVQGRDQPYCRCLNNT